MSSQFTKNSIKDGFITYEGGMNSGSVPELLEPNELSLLVNGTVRGGFVTNRPSFNLKTLTFADPAVRTRMSTARWQGASFFQTGESTGCLVASIGGRLFRFDVTQNSQDIPVTEITISGSMQTTADFTVPDVGSAVVVQVTPTPGILPGFAIQVAGSNYEIQSVDSTSQLTLVNVDATPGETVATGAVVQYWDVNNPDMTQAWLWQSRDYLIINDGESLPIFYNGAVARRSRTQAPYHELPAGRMGAFGNGRNWMSLLDGESYIASDLEGTETAGVPAYLRVTENTYLNGGGAFKVPSGAGTIYAMRFVAVPDTSLGQGPLQVFTPNSVFSCNTPVDRTIWTALENPIQTTSLIANGGLSQYSTVAVNSDLFFRSLDGIRSWILARRDYFSWGNTPVSREVNRVISADDPTLLFYSSAIYFDNRMLMTCSPSFTSQGVWHQGIVALDFDILSSIRGKQPAVWDGLWTGLQTLQLVKGVFDGDERAFAFVLYGDLRDQTTQPTIQISEILKTGQDYKDNGRTSIQWQFETGDLGFNKNGQTDLDVKRLVNGEVFVDEVYGAVTFQTFYRPDSSPCWTPWHKWTICAKDRQCGTGVDGCLLMNNVKPQYRNRMGFGEPSGRTCDETTNSPVREGTSFQIKFIVTGSCRVRKQRYIAVPVPEDMFAKIECTAEDCDLSTQ